MYKLKPERSQIAASDPNHPNPFMFTGRQFDVETGLYYYRARYYSPDLGRFLQTDPVGYGYAYCGNNPLNAVDPTGLILERLSFSQGNGVTPPTVLTLERWCDGKIIETKDFSDLAEFYKWGEEHVEQIREVSPAGSVLSGGNTKIFLALKVLEFLNVFSSVEISLIEGAGWSIVDNTGRRERRFGNSGNGYDAGIKRIWWNPNETFWYPGGSLRDGIDFIRKYRWTKYPAEAGLAHELGHANETLIYGTTSEEYAIMRENGARYAFHTTVPGWWKTWPRPLRGYKDLDSDVEWAWIFYNRTYYFFKHWENH
jgi:RHS repeat-associated protein